MGTDEVECEPMVCEPGGSGLFLPALREYGEQEWPKSLRAVLYLIGLLWLFMAVAIVADIFMGAIERITSRKKRVPAKDTGRLITVKVWNDTVANLTLMALGSSAPEILLSVIELVLMPPRMISGNLGPSTIVGSAAFNLFCITAVCVVAIPNGELRVINEPGVFAITATFSILAYLWLLVIVQFVSPNIIEIWEGCVTLLLFPNLVYVAYLADIGFFRGKAQPANLAGERTKSFDLSEEDVARMEKKIRAIHGKYLTDEELAKLIERESSQPKTRAVYRVGATRAIVGGKRLTMFSEKTVSTLSMKSIVPTMDEIDESSPPATAKPQGRGATVSFTAAHYAVLESVGTIFLPVERKGRLNCRACVEYETRDGTAVASSDYHPVQGTLEFQPGEVEKSISIKIIDDTAYEDDEDFFVELKNSWSDCKDATVSIGDNASAKISIVDDDDPGILCFATDQDSDELQVMEGRDPEKLTVTVKRKLGSIGTVTCGYHTEEGSARQESDYGHAEGTLTFPPGQLTSTIELTINTRGLYETKQFRLVLSQPTGGAKFDGKRDGGPDTQVLTVLISASAEKKHRVDSIMKVLARNYERQRIGHANWREQFRCALLVNGGEDKEEPSVMDWVMHVATVFWKILFATIPPADFAGGWVCFVCALLMIGFVTALIGDLASMLGCVVGMPDSTTAITLVALGTSLPDTFASKVAAQQDPFADASIGNVTGSNSVNVFLGLGLPWLIGAVYWACTGRTEEWQDIYRSKSSTSKYFEEWNKGGGKFIVVGDDLKFSVSVFCVCAIVCLSTLVARRRLLRGELGGPIIVKYATAVFLVCLWLVYVVSSIVYTSRNSVGC